MQFRDIIDQDRLDLNEAIKIIEGSWYHLDESFLGKLSAGVKSKLAFLQELATKTGKDISEIVDLFKDAKVFKFFKTIKFNLGKLWDIVKKGFKFYGDLQRAIAKYIAETKIVKWTEAELAKLDEWLQNHPKFKRVAGIAVAGLLLFIWLNMSFTGDFFYDFDWSDLLAALAGKFSLAELFAGVEGTRLLLLFASGSLLGLSFPWGGSMGAQFVTAVIVGLRNLSKH